MNLKAGKHTARPFSIFQGTGAMAKKGFNTLDALKKIKVKKKLPQQNTKPQVPKPPEPDVFETDNEVQAFYQAMHGVKPLKHVGGRDVAASAPSTPPKKQTPVASEPTMAEIMTRDDEFELEFSEEYMFGFARNLDPKIFQRLKAGQLSWESHIDLHGLNAEQAYDNIIFFIRESFLNNKRCLLIVSGRGKNSPGGMSVLKREIFNWLTRDPLRRVVLAFCSAKPKDGGAGALYVLLRKQKKTKGKVQWEKMKNWDD